MRSHLFLYLAQTRFFWRARTAFAGFRFSCYRNLYGIKHYIREGSTSTRSLLSLLKSTVGELALALGAAAVLQISNPYLVPRFAEWRLSIPQDSDYGTLLATVIGVGGVFIGLYYAAISAVGSAIYARVPNNIRDLLAREKVGGAYIRFVAVFTYFGTSLLAFHSLGLEPIALAVLLLMRKNSLVNQVKFLGLLHALPTVSPSNVQTFCAKLDQRSTDSHYCCKRSAI